MCINHGKIKILTGEAKREGHGGGMNGRTFVRERGEGRNRETNYGV